MLVLFGGRVLFKNSGCFLCKGCFIQCYRFIFMWNSRAPWSFKYAKYNKNIICMKFGKFVKNPTIIKQHSLSGYKSHLSRCEIFYLPVGSCETRAQLQHWRLRMICCMVMFITRQSSDYGITKFTVLITDKDEQTLSLTEQSFALVWSFSLIVVTAWCGCCREAITWVWQPAWDRDSTCFSMCAYFKVNLNMIHV